MGYALLLIESLAWSLLLVATVLACVGRLRRGWLRLALALPAPLVLLVIHVVLTAIAAHFQFVHRIGGWFYPMLALTICVLVGTVWLLIRGLRRADVDPAACAAATWPRAKLAIALVAAVTLYGMTFWNLDSAARQQLAGLRVEAGAVALSVAPPRVPDRDNAALVYQRAFEAMGARSRRTTRFPRGGSGTRLRERLGRRLGANGKRREKSSSTYTTRRCGSSCAGGARSEALATSRGHARLLLRARLRPAQRLHAASRVASLAPRRAAAGSGRDLPCGRRELSPVRGGRQRDFSHGRTYWRRSVVDIGAGRNRRGPRGH